jgi:hypothetical protein
VEFDTPVYREWFPSIVEGALLCRNALSAGTGSDSSAYLFGKLLASVFWRSKVAADDQALRVDFLGQGKIFAKGY